MIRILNNKDYRDPECITETICDCCGKKIVDSMFYNKNHIDMHKKCISKKLTEDIESNAGEIVQEYEEINFAMMTQYEIGLFIEEYIKDYLKVA
ncbi:NDRG family protein [Breznakia sp. OttesenSCG-928-G09]|nr:NDRG family protein [Breznakia sp. OttesenSCG-928-G09]